MTQYFVYDVFTNSPFGGNQLAVIPDATTIAEESLQKIAREFNFSETTFVYPPNDPAHTAKVRIFTPTMEIPHSVRCLTIRVLAETLLLSGIAVCSWKELISFQIR